MNEPTLTHSSAAITVTAHATGWHIEATGTSPYPFTADLPACDCDGAKVKASSPCAGHTHGHLECKPAVGRCRLPKQRGGYHREHVARFVKAVAGTYGAKTDAPTVPGIPAD
jgi:hypothetical protein